MASTWLPAPDLVERIPDTVARSRLLDGLRAMGIPNAVLDQLAGVTMTADSLVLELWLDLPGRTRTPSLIVRVPIGDA
jgi:hypothetical protein